jgi:hypothetical protein
MMVEKDVQAYNQPLLTFWLIDWIGSRSQSYLTGIAGVIR